MMQRHFARLQHNGDGVFFVHLDGDFLAAREQIVFREGVPVRNLFLRVRAGNEAHRAVRFIAGRECDPRGDDVGFIEAPVSRILMPGNEGRIACFLDEKVGGPAQQVRAVKIFDGVHDVGVAHQIAQP